MTVILLTNNIKYNNNSNKSNAVMILLHAQNTRSIFFSIRRTDFQKTF